MNFKVLKIEKGDGCLRTAEIEVAPDEVQQKVNSIYKELAKSVRIPGFRVGHVPRKILEIRFSKQVYQQALDEIIPQVIEEVIKSNNLRLISTPVVSEIKAEEGKPVWFKVTLEIYPEIKLGDYIGIPVKKEPILVTDKEIETALQKIREAHAQFIPVQDRPAEKHDYLLIDFEGTINGKKFAGSSVKGFFFELGAGEVFPEFEKALLGKSVGCKEKILVTFPKDYANNELAGKTAIYEVTIREIKTKKLPPLDDEFAKEIEPGLTLEELRKRISDELYKEKEKQMKEKLRNDIIEALLKTSSMELPASLVEKYSEQILSRYKFRMQQAGVTYEQIGLTPEQAKNESIEIAKREIKAAFILDAIAEKENITVSDEELENEIEKRAIELNLSPNKYKAYLLEQNKLESLRAYIREEKVLDFLLSKATVLERVVLPDETVVKYNKKRGNQ